MSRSLTIAANELPHGLPAPGLLGLVERGFVPDAFVRLGIPGKTA